MCCAHITALVTDAHRRYGLQVYQLLHSSSLLVNSVATVISNSLRSMAGSAEAPQAQAGPSSTARSDDSSSASTFAAHSTAARSKWRATQRSWREIGAGDVVDYDDSVSLTYACGTTPIHACLFHAMLCKHVTYVAVADQVALRVTTVADVMAVVASQRERHWRWVQDCRTLRGQWGGVDRRMPVFPEAHGGACRIWVEHCSTVCAPCCHS